MKNIKEIAKRLYAKIPECRPGSGLTAFHISKWQIKKLDDDEFAFLYYAPGLTIHVAKSTARYIERRRRELKLLRPEEIPPLPTLRKDA